MIIAILDFNQTEQNHSHVSSLLIILFQKQAAAVAIHLAIGKLAMVLMILSEFLKLQLYVDKRFIWRKSGISEGG